MLKVLLVLASVLVTVPALAGEEKKTIYSQILDWSKQGTPVTFAEVKGYYRGICVQMIGRDKADPSALIADTLSPNGPAFPGRDLMLAIRASQAMTVAQMTGYLREYAGNYSDVRTEDGQLVNDWDMEPNKRADQKLKLVRYQDYLVLTSEELIGQNYYSNVHGREFYAKKGEVVDACYYYQKL